MASARQAGQPLVPDELDVPPRSRIVIAEPIGLGTAEVEAFSSFLPRTARRNDLPMGLFARYILAPVLGRSGSRGATRADWGRYFAHIFSLVRGTLDGLGLHARTWTTAIEEASLRHGLSRLTLLRFAAVLPPTRLTRSVRWWCPVCLHEQALIQPSEDDGPEEERVYEPLLWRLSPLETCYRHERPVPLAHVCQGCRAESPILSTWGVPGRCAGCGAWLGRRITEIPQADATAWSKYVWIECRRVIVAAQSEKPLGASTVDVAAALSDALKARRETRQGLARRIGYSLAAVSLWASGRRQIPLPAALRVGFILGIHVDALYQGLVARLPETATECPLPAARRAVDWPAVERHLRRAAGSSRPWSVTDIAAHHGADRREIRRRLPALAAEVAQRHAAWRRALIAARRARSEREIRDAARDLVERGFYPSRDRVQRKLRHRADMRDPRLRAAWKGALAELGLV